ncbi:SET domain-containing protein [Coniophora puteana RWD-64-598 SS2]|uniref:SET domain-containing protein n=1 Tax=Coniophora puteana (strain RWD-64-598) TaxID=741705 RepID=A0A5M3MQX7_CONPW|nr:SET domain-containing protein [Coniophora puteana RWD-64-598 SS2]EIW81467.1 SET domain-containing protein [Coniophora puteana RWD-64-598 SS2]
MRWPGAPFLYDNKGLLHIQEYPIFECNEFCGCDDDCPNRVVQSGRKHIVNIVRTENKGWGVRIPKGAFIGIYAGELLTSAECEERGTIYDENGRTYLFDVDFWYIDRSEHDYTVDAFHAGNVSLLSEPKSINNHSCDPNCNITPCYINEGNLQKPLLVLFTNREVEAYEELCFSYLGDIEEYKKDHAEELDEPGNVS